MDDSPYQPPPRPAEAGRSGRSSDFYPLTIGRVVSLSFSMYRFGWRTFVAISLIAAVPVVVATGVITLLTYDQMNAWQQLLVLSTSTLPDGGSAASTTSADLIAAFPWSAAAATFVVTLLVGAISVIGSGALTHAIAAALSGDRLSTRQSYSVVLRRLSGLLAVYLIVTLLGIGLSVLVVLAPLLLAAGPGAFGGGGPIAFVGLVAIVAIFFITAFLVIRTIFSVQVLVLEQLPAVASVRRSYSLVEGSMLRVIGYAIVFGLILGLIGLVISFFAVFVGLVISPASPTSLTALTLSAPSVFVQTLITNLLSEVFSPILAIGFVLLYYDIRFRRGEQVPAPGGQATAAQTRS